MDHLCKSWAPLLTVTATRLCAASFTGQITYMAHNGLISLVHRFNSAREMKKYQLPLFFYFFKINDEKNKDDTNCSKNNRG